MSQNVTTQFPEERYAAMLADAESFDRKSARLDSCSEKTRSLLNGIIHRDASESIWFARQLEYIRPGLMEVLYPALEGKSFIPVDSAVGPGASNYTYRSFDKVGAAGLVDDYAMDPPRADVFGKETTQAIKPYGVMYGYNFQELRAGMLAGLPLDVRKAMAARYAMELKIDQIIFYGDTASGLKGLTTLTGTESFTVANGVKGTKLWHDKTSDEIVRDMHAIVNTLVNASHGVYRPNTLILPLRAYNIAATKRMGDGSNETCLSFFENTSPYIKNGGEVRSSYRLDQSESGNWSGSTGRMIAYEKSPDRLSFLLPVEFEQLPPQQVGYEYKTLCHSRIGGAIAPHPTSIAFGDGITDSTD